MSGLLQTAFAANGYSGPDMPNFADAIGNGTVDSIVGKAFSTSDTGTTPGAGVGTGTGISGVVQATLSAALFSGFVSAFGQSGPDLPDIADALADALVQELALASLNSTHTPVYLGNGTVVVGSIAVVAAAMGAAITAEGAGAGFVGMNWPDAAGVIGDEYAGAIIAGGTGAVVITGSPAGTPAPGVGTGTGTIT